MERLIESPNLPLQFVKQRGELLPNSLENLSLAAKHAYATLG